MHRSRIAGPGVIVLIALLSLIVPGSAPAASTEVLSGPGVVSVTLDGGPHQLQVYTSNVNPNPAPTNWVGIGFVTEAALAAAEASLPKKASPVGWAKAAAATLAASAFALSQIVGAGQLQETERRLVVYDSLPGATVKGEPKVAGRSGNCTASRAAGSSTLRSNMVDCGLTGLTHLYVRVGQDATGTAPAGKPFDTIDLTRVVCDACFSPDGQQIEIRGSNRNDAIYGSRYGEVLEGGVGHDRIQAGDGADELFGFYQESPFQNLVYRYTPVTADVAFKSYPDPDDDRLFGQGGIDSISAGPGNDLVDGGDDSDSTSRLIFNDPSVVPGLGEQHIYDLLGGGGDDVVIGGPGEDTMQGGPGRDTMLARESDNGFTDELDRVDCEKPSLGTPSGPEYYRISKPGPTTPGAPTDRLANCGEELATYPSVDLANWPPGKPWPWYR